MTQAEYKVALDNFAGPMDLLLFLIRKEEINIRDIPITRILEQYMSYIEGIEAIDLDSAGEFLVMASTLMVIKSKMLLPVEEVDLTEELDPRYELVRQLLEYKKIRERTRSLDRLENIQMQRTGRPESARPEPMVEKDKSLDDVQVWDLLRLLQKVLAETGGDVRKTRVITSNDIPVRECAAGIEERLRKGPMSFLAILGEQSGRNAVIGYFLAVLLLLKVQSVRIRPVAGQEDFEIELNTESIAGDQPQQELELGDDFRS